MITGLKFYRKAAVIASRYDLAGCLTEDLVVPGRQARHGDWIYVIVPRDGQRFLACVRWGFNPVTGGNANARIENTDRRSGWTSRLRSHRCIIPASTVEVGGVEVEGLDPFLLLGGVWGACDGTGQPCEDLPLLEMGRGVAATLTQKGSRGNAHLDVSRSPVVIPERWSDTWLRRDLADFRSLRETIASFQPFLAPTEAFWERVGPFQGRTAESSSAAS